MEFYYFLFTCISCRVKIFVSGREIPSETFGLHDASRNIARSIVEHRSRLEQQIALEAEYVSTLQELEQITDVAEALVDSPIAVSSLEHLQEEVSCDNRVNVSSLSSFFFSF